MIGLPDGAEAAVLAARPARLVQSLTGDAGSVVQALAGATFSGPRHDASALTLAVREVLRAPHARSLMPAVDAIGADLAHQYQLAYVTTEPALAATRLRVAVAEGGTTATAEATVRVPASSGPSAPRALASLVRSLASSWRSRRGRHRW
jgi:hypothetical protein